MRTIKQTRKLKKSVAAKNKTARELFNFCSLSESCYFGNLPLIMHIPEYTMGSKNYYVQFCFSSILKSFVVSLNRSCINKHECMLILSESVIVKLYAGFKTIRRQPCFLGVINLLMPWNTLTQFYEACKHTNLLSAEKFCLTETGNQQKFHMFYIGTTGVVPQREQCFLSNSFSKDMEEENNCNCILMTDIYFNILCRQIYAERF